jgi:hypothetical protein
MLQNKNRTRSFFEPLRRQQRAVERAGIVGQPLNGVFSDGLKAQKHVVAIDLKTTA